MSHTSSLSYNEVPLGGRVRHKVTLDLKTVNSNVLVNTYMCINPYLFNRKGSEWRESLSLNGYFFLDIDNSKPLKELLSLKDGSVKRLSVVRH